MADPLPIPLADDTCSRAEIARLNEIIRRLMNRTERSGNVRRSKLGAFRKSNALEERVRTRMAALQKALRVNERINQALHESETKFRSLVNQAPVGVGIIENGKFTYTNPKLDEMFGYSTDELRELDPLHLVSDGDRPMILENIRKGLDTETKAAHFMFHGIRKGGTVIEVELYAAALNVGAKLALGGLIMDVTARNRAESEVQALQDQLREQSTHDALTGLYNRRALDEMLARELILAERAGHPVSVIMGDLDHFKKINDSEGHLAGDEVLRVFGELMRKCSRGSDIYCRYGGEEFLLVLPGMSEEGAVRRAEQLRRALEATLVPYGHSRITVTASFGVSAFPRDGRTGDKLIKAADVALYAAKSAGRNCVRSALYNQ